MLRKITMAWSVLGIASALATACGDFPITTDPVFSPAPGNPYGGSTRNPGAYVPGSSPQPTMGSGTSSSTNPSAAPAAAGSAQHNTTSSGASGASGTTSGNESGSTPSTTGSTGSVPATGTNVRSTSIEITSNVDVNDAREPLGVPYNLVTRDTTPLGDHEATMNVDAK